MKTEYLVHVLNQAESDSIYHYETLHEAVHKILHAREQGDSASFIAVKEEGLPRWPTLEEMNEFKEILSRVSIERKL